MRAESAEHRTRAKTAKEAGAPLQARLHNFLVADTGRHTDPTDLTVDAGHLEDDDALGAAIDAHLEAKPHLASRTVSGDIGQSAGDGSSSAPSMAAVFSARA